MRKEKKPAVSERAIAKNDVIEIRSAYSQPRVAARRSRQSGNLQQPWKSTRSKRNPRKRRESINEMSDLKIKWNIEPAVAAVVARRS